MNRWCFAMLAIRFRSAGSACLPLPLQQLQARVLPPSTSLQTRGLKKSRWKKFSNKEKKQWRRDQHKQREKQRIQKLKRQKGLHKAAKWKRILSATDHWFSKGNLIQDEFVQRTLQEHNGCIPLPTLLTFPKFHHWVDLELLHGAYTSEAAKNRYQIVFDSGDIIPPPKKLQSTDKGIHNKSRGDAHHDFYGNEDGDYLWEDCDDYVSSDDDDDDDDYYQQYTTDYDGYEMIYEEEEEATTTRAEQATASKFKDPDLSDALLRHKRVNLETIERWKQESLEAECELTIEANDYDTKPKKKNPKKTKYSSKREIVLISNARNLESFCSRLKKSVAAFAEHHNNDPRASAVGFDVEYSSLDLDIRNTLPAMVQVAAPQNDASSPVGLIWLDRFPDHGRNLLTDNNSDYKPLLDILADPNLRKVGVGASGDIKHLATWWGMSAGDYSSHGHYFFGGITDLEDQQLPDVPEQEVEIRKVRLADLCSHVLQRRLVKSKQTLTGKQKKRKKQGRKTPTGHWRTNNITKEMKVYAANDAACGIDIWLKLHGLSRKE